MKQTFISILLMLLPMLASADAVEIDGIWYNLFTEENVAEVTRNHSTDNYTGEITIPDKITYEGTEYSVAKIGEWAFAYCRQLTSIIIPISVTSIGFSAFSYCIGLSSICIPNSVTTIGESAFSGCSSLSFITISNGVSSIGKGAFYGCYDLPSITLPNSVTTIGESAFSGCSGLKSVTISNNVTSISDFVFAGCSSLDSLTIPNSVTSIGEFAFRNCRSLKSITISNSINSIGMASFQYCSSLTSITIPNSVTSIGEGAFGGCVGLSSIKVENGNPQYDSRNDCNAIIETLSNSLIAGCKNTTIPNSVNSIGYAAFVECSSLTSISIPNSITSICECAFLECSSITSIIIPSSVQSIGSSAFYNCVQIRDVFCLSDKVTNQSSNGEGLYADPSAFSLSPNNKITLHVPASSIEVYRSTEPWSQFGKIVALTDEEITPTRIKSLVEDIPNYPVNIYSIDGKRTQKELRGLNIIRMKNGKSIKRIVK